VNSVADSGSFLRRGQDFPLLILSLDYELFFHRSGSVDNCLIEPTDMMLDFADRHELRLTFFVDAGMLCRMEQLAPGSPELARDLSRIKAHISTFAARGHEVGLHVHPHWEDTRRANGRWDFSGTRYQVRDFSDDEVGDIVTRYTATLNALCDGKVATYRAGGFCFEPFGRLRRPLLDNGIHIDSSIVSGLHIEDPDKGVDFRPAPDRTWWHFEASPLEAEAQGSFLEIPVTATRLPPWHYWGRAVNRVLRRQPSSVSGDGASKPIGRHEIVRRLAGGGRTSELSVDAPKSATLLKAAFRNPKRSVWHAMGHPKLFGRSTLENLEKFIARTGIQRCETLSGVAAAIRAKELSAYRD